MERSFTRFDRAALWVDRSITVAARNESRRGNDKEHNHSAVPTPVFDPYYNGPGISERL